MLGTVLKGFINAFVVSLYVCESHFYNNQIEKKKFYMQYIGEVKSVQKVLSRTREMP